MHAGCTKIDRMYGKKAGIRDLFFSGMVTGIKKKFRGSITELPDPMNPAVKMRSDFLLRW